MSILLISQIGSATDWQYPAYAAWASRTTKHKRCEESDCCIFREGGSRKIYNSWYIHSDSCGRIALMADSESSSGICTKRTSEWHPRHRHFWTLDPYSSEFVRRATIVFKSVDHSLHSGTILTPPRQSTCSPIELWREIHVNGLSGWRCCTGGMAWPDGHEGFTAAST